MKTINSKRRFTIQTNTNGTTEYFTVQLVEIVDEKEEGEVFYALQEQLDEILDLAVNDSIYFQPNRDDVNSKGIIARIK